MKSASQIGALVASVLVAISYRLALQARDPAVD